MSNKISLNGVWRLCYDDTSIEAQVPGNVELDLQRAGILDEPFYGMNIVEANAFTKDKTFTYTRTFEYQSKACRQFLVFEGIDCYADLYLNGEFLMFTDNMLIPHRFEVTGKLLDGENTISVVITPTTQHAKQYDYGAVEVGLGFADDALHVRKAPHMYGWDIMPRMLSAGLWRDVYIEETPQGYISEWSVRARDFDFGNRTVGLRVFYRIDGEVDKGCAVRIRGICRDHSFTHEQNIYSFVGFIDITVTNPHLWYPRGKGNPDLYDVTLEFVRDGAVVDIATMRTGLRKVELKRTSINIASPTHQKPDTSAINVPEGEFVFIVNGERVFCKGTNHVPLDAFHSRDKARIPKEFEMLTDLNCNMIRCWGGNVYEDDLFYELADENGIMIWQDFTMACGIYPSTQEWLERFEQEVATIVRRLRHHPSIVLWAGDNECDMFYYQNHIDPNHNVITRQLIPSMLRRHDDTRPYLASSPNVDALAYQYGTDYTSEFHLWGVRDTFKSRFYQDSTCNFVSEIGYHGCNSPASLAKFIAPDKLWPIHNEQWLLHASSPVPGIDIYDYRIKLMEKQLREFFTQTPDNLADFSRMSQIVQAEAKKFFIELFRTFKWRKTGILWWNLLDGWPQISDAVVDYYFEKKLAYHYIKQAQQDVLVALREPRGWYNEIVVCNDTRDDVQLHVEIIDIDTDERIYANDVTAKADDATVIGKLDYMRNMQRMYKIIWNGDVSGTNHYVCGEMTFDYGDYTRWFEKLYPTLCE